MRVDAVITWVDGNDPVLKKKRAEAGDPKIFQQADVAGDTRYANVGEIFWCVASLNRFAPWINRIFIITDGQDPGLQPFLDKHFPDGQIPVRIIDHKEIFRGYEQYLPVFNSIAIETMMWRIPGLSEHFITLNDDFLLAAPVRMEDFFPDEERLVCYASRYNALWTRATRWLKQRREGRLPVTFKGMMMNAMDVLGGGSYFLKIDHTPRGLRKSFYEAFYKEHPDLMLRNIAHRFRDPQQYSVEEIQLLSEYRDGRCEVLPVKGNLFYMEPKNKPGYVRAKMDKLRKGDYKFMCFNSLDQASDDDRRLVAAWVEERLGL